MDATIESLRAELRAVEERASARLERAEASVEHVQRVQRAAAEALRELAEVRARVDRVGRDLAALKRSMQ